MTREYALTRVIDALASEGLVDSDQSKRGRELAQSFHAVQPWFVRVMVGFGAWLASLMLVGFVATFGFAAEGSHALIGIGLAAGSVYLRRRSDNDFSVQSALAISLAGQLMFVLGVAQLVDWDSPKLVVAMMLLMAAAMFVVFPDRLHRVLMVLIAAASLVTLVYLWKWNSLVPVLGPLFAVELAAIRKFEGAWYASGRGEFVRPLSTGIMLAAFGCLSLSTVYVLPELSVMFQFYPRPWVSTVLLGALLIYVATDCWRPMLEADSMASRVTVYALLLLIVAAAWAAPGLLLALVVIMLGMRAGDRMAAGAGVAFLVVFLAAFFYGIETTLLEKSMTLVATGIAILVARWVLLRSLFGAGEQTDAA